MQVQIPKARDALALARIKSAAPWNVLPIGAENHPLLHLFPDERRK